jgi:hypothetical protein
MSIIAGTTGDARIFFGDSGDENAGIVSYDNNTDTLWARAGGTGTHWEIESDGQIRWGNPSPGTGEDDYAEAHVYDASGLYLDPTGTPAWAYVSDVNKKMNVQIHDTSGTKQIIESFNMYSYNMKELVKVYELDDGTTTTSKPDWQRFTQVQKKDAITTSINFLQLEDRVSSGTEWIIDDNGGTTEIATYAFTQNEAFLTTRTLFTPFRKNYFKDPDQYFLDKVIVGYNEGVAYDTVKTTRVVQGVTQDIRTSEVLTLNPLWADSLIEYGEITGQEIIVHEDLTTSSQDIIKTRSLYNEPKYISSFVTVTDDIITTNIETDCVATTSPTQVPIYNWRYRIKNSVNRLKINEDLFVAEFQDQLTTTSNPLGMRIKKLQIRQKEQ